MKKYFYIARDTTTNDVFMYSERPDRSSKDDFELFNINGDSHFLPKGFIKEFFGIELRNGECKMFSITDGDILNNIFQKSV